jgi:serine/threonine protein kinase
MLERIGKYRVIREIGKGATATVYLCKCDDMDEMVAVKLVDFGDKNRDQGKWSRRMRKLFLTEAAIAAKLDHPNIIRIYDAQVEENRPIWSWSSSTASRSTTTANSTRCCRCRAR